MDDRPQGPSGSYACLLPDFGEADARVTRWLVEPGDPVTEDEPIVEIETLGGPATIDSAVSGVLARIEAEVGETVRVGGVLAIITPAQRANPEVLARALNADDPVFEAPGLPSAIASDGIEIRLKSMGDKPPWDRITALRALYEEELLSLWRTFARAADAWVDAAEASANDCRARAQERHDAQLAKIDADYRRNTAEAEAELAAARAELDARHKAGNDLANVAWKKLGPGLELALPEADLARRRSDLRGAGEAASFASLKAQAAALPEVPLEKDDKTLTRHWWWAAVGIGLISAGFVGFWAALAIGLAAGAGVYFYRLHVRTEARAAYEALLDGIARFQASSTGELEQRKAALEAKVRESKARARDLKAASEHRRDQVFSAIHQAKAVAWQAAIAAYDRSRATWEALAADVAAAIDQAAAEAPALFGPWSGLENLKPGPSDDLPYAAQVRLRIGSALSPAGDRCKLSADAPKGLADTGPWCWSLAEGKSLMFMDSYPSGEGRDSFAAPVLARLLNQLPPGKAHLTLFDPIGLGRNFGGFVKLGDYTDQLINGRVWSNGDDIKQRLRDLIGHIERVTQKYLRNEHRDIESYNSTAGEIAEPYRILVLADFPECFDEDIMRDLLRIAQNGPRCGVFTIMHANLATPPPRGIDLEVLKPFFIQLHREGQTREYAVVGGSDPDRRIRFDVAPEDDQTNLIVEAYGKGAQGALKVEVPYQRLLELAECAGSIWSASSLGGIRVPLGPAGGKKVQFIELGSGLCHHGLLTGRPGSGKSNLLHVFITTAARLYSPDELQLYLVDFKQGVEFKPYAEAALPHARVIAVESEREFGLSVLQGLEAEMTRRGELFRTAGAENLADYRRKTGAVLPRVVLVIDEFQEFFVRDDKLKREAATLIGRLVSQARYAGIHLLLGSQSLATAALERAVRDQMTIRIALQSSEADSRLILAEDNTAARMLTRPGEAIYNNDAGSPTGNSLFQVALFTGDDRALQLKLIAQAAEAAGWEGEPPVIFEGHSPGDITTCRPLAAPSGPATEDPPNFQLWLGEPTSLRPAVTAVMKRHAGRNLAVLSREEEEGAGVILAAMMSLAAQTPSDRASFQIVDLTSADADWADHPECFAEALPHVAEVTGRHEFRRVVSDLAATVRQRSEDGAMKESAIFLVVLGLHRIRDLKQEGSSFIGGSLLDDPVDVRGSLAEILRDGPEVGVHVLLWCDAYANLDRALDRGGLGELGIKVAGPLTDQESRRLFDDDVAAHLDKPHRMIFGDDDRVGVLETFRPYRLPDHDFIKALGARLRQPVERKPSKKAPKGKPQND